MRIILILLLQCIGIITVYSQRPNIQLEIDDDNNKFEQSEYYRNKNSKTSTKSVGILLGNSTQTVFNNSLFLLDDGKLYKGPTYHIDGVFIVNRSNKRISKWIDQPVIYQYKKRKNLNTLLKVVHGKPDKFSKYLPFLNSATESNKSNHLIKKTTKEKLKNLTYYEVVDISHYNGIEITRLNNSSHIYIRNDLDNFISNLSVAGYYECEDKDEKPQFILKKYNGINPQESKKTVFENSIKTKGLQSKTFNIKSIVIEFIINGNKSILVFPVY